MSQRRTVERLLREQGAQGIAVHTLIYRFGITRAAAYVHELRSEGWNIETRDEDKGELAVYVLRGEPSAARAATAQLSPVEREMRAHFHTEETTLPPGREMKLPCGCVRAADGRAWTRRCDKHAGALTSLRDPVR